MNPVRSAATRHDVQMRRVWPALLVAALVSPGCSRIDKVFGTTTTSSTIAPWTTDPEADLWVPLVDTCAAANDVALADAERLLPLHTAPPAADVAEYYRDHADQVVALVEQFRTMTPPSTVADEWSEALDRLDTYASWARAAAAAAEDGEKADLTPDPGLELFRTLMPYGACHDLLDVN